MSVHDFSVLPASYLSIFGTCYYFGNGRHRCTTIALMHCNAYTITEATVNDQPHRQAPLSFSMLHTEKQEGAWYLIPPDSQNDDILHDSASKNISC